MFSENWLEGGLMGDYLENGYQSRLWVACFTETEPQGGNGDRVFGRCCEMRSKVVGLGYWEMSV